MKLFSLPVELAPGWTPTSGRLRQLCAACSARSDSQLSVPRNAPNYNTRRRLERKPPPCAPHCGCMRALFTPLSVPSPILACTCRLSNALPRKKAMRGLPAPLAYMRDRLHVLHFARTRRNPCAPPILALKHEMLSLKQMQYTSKIN
jgi:hypothetical protein